MVATRIRRLGNHATQFPHVKHALLALAETHRKTREPRAWPPVAGLEHRSKAICGVNKAISAGSSLSQLELDSLLATCFILTTQTSYMEQSLRELITLLRGCGLVTALPRARPPAAASLFRTGDSDHIGAMAASFVGKRSIDGKIVEAAAQSLAATTKSHLQGAHAQFWNLLFDTVNALGDRPWQAYLSFTKIYAALLSHPSRDIQQLLDEKEAVSQVLLIQFVATQAIVSLLTICEAGDRAAYMPTQPFASWIESKSEHLDDSARSACTAWPAQVARAVREAGNMPWPSFRSLADRVGNEPAVFSLDI